MDLLGDIGGLFEALKHIGAFLLALITKGNFNLAIIAESFRKGDEDHKKQGFDRLVVAKNEIKSR